MDGSPPWPTVRNPLLITDKPIRQALERAGARLSEVSRLVVSANRRFPTRAGYLWSVGPPPDEIPRECLRAGQFLALLQRFLRHLSSPVFE